MTWVKLRGLLYLCLLCFIAFISYLALPFWSVVIDEINQPISQVKVNVNLVSLTKVKIEKMIKPFLINRFFSLDLTSMRESLIADPWVKDVMIKRVWPNTLKIVIKEQKPVAVWKKNQLITNEGVVFTPETIDEYRYLPLLVGVKINTVDVMQHYLFMSKLLQPIGLTIGELRVAEVGSWIFKLDHVYVDLGREVYAERLQKFIFLYRTHLKSKWAKVSRVDLRYPNGAAIAWR